jgi:hypothetical protein
MNSRCVRCNATNIVFGMAKWCMTVIEVCPYSKASPLSLARTFVESSTEETCPHFGRNLPV